jgi:cytoskeleton protein RodZ
VRDPDTVRADRGSPNWLGAAVVAMVVVVVLLAVGVFSGGEGEGPDTVAGTPDEVAEPESAPPPQAEPPPPPPPSGVSVRIAVQSDRSWLRVTDAEDATLFEGTLEAGAVQEFRDENGLDLTVGDAGAVTLVVNGQDLGSPGPSGEVARLSYAAGEAPDAD